MKKVTHPPDQKAQKTDEQGSSVCRFDMYGATLSFRWDEFCTIWESTPNIEDVILGELDKLAHFFLVPLSDIKRLMYLINLHVPADAKVTMTKELRNDVFLGWLSRTIENCRAKCFFEECSWGIESFVSKPLGKDSTKLVGQDKAKRISFLLHEAYAIKLNDGKYFRQIHQFNPALCDDIIDLISVENKGLTRSLFYDDGSSQDGSIDYTLRKALNGKDVLNDEKRMLATLAQEGTHWLIQEYLLEKKASDNAVIDRDRFVENIRNARFQGSKYLAAPKTDAISYLCNETSEVVNFVANCDENLLPPW